jgi:hypothetical protein
MQTVKKMIQNVEALRESTAGTLSGRRVAASGPTTAGGPESIPGLLKCLKIPSLQIRIHSVMET